jgi:hypothetical protein
MRKYEQYQATNERRPARKTKCCARCLEQLSIRDTRWTCRFTCATAEAAVNVQLNTLVVWSDSSLEQRPHEKNPAAWTFVLVLENLICGTSLQAESAVNALIDSGERSGKRRIRKGARRLCICRLRTLIYHVKWDAHSFGPRMPGFKMLNGSKAVLTR